MKKTTLKILSFAIFLVGAAFLINYQTDITGSFLDSNSTAYVFSFWIGIALLIVSVIIFSSTLTLEKIALSSSIKKNPGLLRLTQETVRDEIVEREMNHLIEQLSIDQLGNLLNKKLHRQAQITIALAICNWL